MTLSSASLVESAEWRLGGVVEATPTALPGLGPLRRHHVWEDGNHPTYINIYIGEGESFSLIKKTSKKNQLLGLNMLRWR